MTQRKDFPSGEDAVRETVLSLWDSGLPPPAGAEAVLTWNGYVEGAGEGRRTRSILRYVDRNAERLRGKYLRWVHDAGETVIDGRSLIDRLTFEDGFSYWWMTLIAEKSIWKQPSITDAMRLFALEEILLEETPAKLSATTGSDDLHQALAGLCANLGLKFERHHPPRGSRQNVGARRILRALPQPVQGLLSLIRNVATRWPLRTSVPGSTGGPRRPILLCSYFLYFDQAKAAHGKFQSGYWSVVPDILLSRRRETTLLHHYVRSPTAPTPGSARRIADNFNARPAENGHHVFLDGYISPPIILRATRRWLRLVRIRRRLKGIEAAFSPRESAITLWPLMRDDWRASLEGSVAISNVLWFELFKRALSSMRRQETGAYLCENQGWERAFVHHWKKSGHGKLVGFPHGTNRRFWELNNYHDPRTLRSGSGAALPWPDIIALSSKTAISDYVGTGYPRQRIEECEALRYGYLRDITAAAAVPGTRAERRVLVLGDYLPAPTRQMMTLLEEAAAELGSFASFTVKPHPNCMVHQADHPRVEFEVSTRPLAELLPSFDIAYTSNMTTASFDVCAVGMPVVVALDPTRLNFSPVRGIEGATFVATGGELADAIIDARGTGTTALRDDLFLDAGLPRWKSLLELDELPLSKPRSSAHIP